MARAKTKTKPVEVEIDEDEETDDVEEVDDDDLLLDEDDEDDEIPVAKKSTKAKKKKTPADDVTFGVKDLCEWLTAHNDNGKVYQPKDLRNLLRRMAREDSPRINREIIAGNKARYDWPLGLKDPEVKRVIKAVQGGEIESARKEQLDKLKERKAAKDAAAGKGAKSAAKRKQKAAVIEDDEDDLDEDFEDDEE